MATASMALNRPGPRIATTAIASSSVGSASMMSIRRMTSASTIPPANAAISPSSVPTRKACATTTAPIDSDSRAPYSRRENTSRPTSSVPSG